MHEGQHTFSHLLRWNFQKIPSHSDALRHRQKVQPQSLYGPRTPNGGGGHKLRFILSCEEPLCPSSKEDEKKPSKEFTFIHPGCVLCNPAGGLVRAHVDIRRVWYAFTAWVLSVRCHCIPRSPVLASPRSVLQHASLGARRPVRRRLMTARSVGQSMVVGALMRDELKS